MPVFAPYYFVNDSKAFIRIDSANTDYYWYYSSNYRRIGHVTVAPMFFFNISQNNIGVSLVSGAIATCPEVSISETTSNIYNAVSGRVYYYYAHSTNWYGFQPVPSEGFPDTTPSIDTITFNSISEGIEAIDNYVPPSATYPITYRVVNCETPTAPTSARVGDNVTVIPSFTSGYGIVNPSDIYVTCNGVTIPSTYSNGVLTFTMPDPSQ